MLHDITYYYQKSRDSGVHSLDCKMSAYIRNPISGKTQEWPEVRTWYDYINKCYSIAQEFPIEGLYQEYYEARFQSKEALERVHLKVIDALNTLNDKDLNHMMGYTPISHIREQLLTLSDRISSDIINHRPVAPRAIHRKTLVRKNFIMRLFD